MKSTGLAAALTFACLFAANTSRAEEAPVQETRPVTPSPSPVVSAVPVMPAATRREPQANETCGRRWAEQVYPTVRSSVVRVRTVGGLGSGFVFGDDRHVATAFHVVALGRPLTVELADGHEHTARAVAVDQAHDLAILELDEPLPLPPLPLVSPNESPAIGAEVMVVGHPLSGGIRAPGPYKLEGLLDWSATRGIIAAKNQVFWQTDAAINPGNSGGPLVDCGGRVLGVVSWKVGSSLAFAVRGELLDALWKAPRSVYLGRWSGTGAFSVLLHLNRGSPGYMGIGFGLGGHVVDRVDYMLRGAWLWGFDPDEGNIVVDTRRRITAQFETRARLLLVPRRAIYLAVGGGAAYWHDLLRARRFELGTVAGCSGAACQEVRAANLRTSLHSFRPLATVALLGGGGGELGYSLLIDAGHFADSVHQIGLSAVTD